MGININGQNIDPIFSKAPRQIGLDDTDVERLWTQKGAECESLRNTDSASSSED